MLHPQEQRSRDLTMLLQMKFIHAGRLWAPNANCAFIYLIENICYHILEAETSHRQENLVEYKLLPGLLSLYI